MTMQATSPHWNGEEYAKISFPQFQTNTAFLNEHIFLGNETILDIGCGDGQTSHDMANRVPAGSVFGIDASDSMIEMANQHNQKTNVTFQLRRAEAIDFENQFDLATCFFCMQWIPDKKALFQKIYSALKPQGRFLMIVPLPHPQLPALRKKLIAESHWKDFFTDYTDPLIHINDVNYEQYAVDAGLKVVACRMEPTPLRFPNYAAFFGFMKQMTPHISCLESQELKALFIKELIEEYAKVSPPTPDGAYELIYNLFKFHSYRP